MYEDAAKQVQDAMQELFNPTKPYLTAWVWIHDSDVDMTPFSCLTQFFTKGGLVNYLSISLDMK